MWNRCAEKSHIEIVPEKLREKSLSSHQQLELLYMSFIGKEKQFMGDKDEDRYVRKWRNIEE